MGTTSKGNQTKYWEGDWLIKCDSPGWYESISEVLVSELQHHIVNPLPYVDYFFTSYRGFPACKCKNFLKSNESVVSLYNLLESTGLYLPYEEGGEYLKDVVCGVLNMEYDINIEKYLAYIFYLDAIVLNEDRHLRNISFIKKGNKVSFAPVYDFGLSLLSDTTTYTKIEDRFKVKSQPFSTDFVSQLKMFDNPEIKIQYNDLSNVLQHAYNNPNLYVDLNYIDYLKRGIEVLMLRLKETEGILWTRV